MRVIFSYMWIQLSSQPKRKSLVFLGSLCNVSWDLKYHSWDQLIHCFLSCRLRFGFKIGEPSGKSKKTYPMLKLLNLWKPKIAKESVNWWSLLWCNRPKSWQKMVWLLANLRPPFWDLLRRHPAPIQLCTKNLSRKNSQMKKTTDLLLLRTQLTSQPIEFWNSLPDLFAETSLLFLLQVKIEIEICILTA